MVHLFELTSSLKKDKGVQAWCPPGGSGYASVVHAYAALYTILHAVQAAVFMM